MNFGIIAAGGRIEACAGGCEAFPKPLVPLNGEPMIGRLIRIFQENGAERICVIVNEHMSEVRQFVERLQRELPVHIELVVKTTPSSMHSFYEIGRLLKGAHGRFIVTTVDTIFREPDFAGYVRAYESASAENRGYDGGDIVCGR